MKKLMLIAVLLAGCIDQKEIHASCSDWCRQIGARQVAIDRGGRCACVLDILPESSGPSCPLPVR